MAKRRKRRPRQKAATVDYVDAEGNMLTLRQSLSRGTIAQDRRGPGDGGDDRRRTPGAAARSCSSSGSRCSWEIAGLPLDDQKMLLGRYRMADAATQQWVRETIARHVERTSPSWRRPAERRGGLSRRAAWPSGRRTPPR